MPHNRAVSLRAVSSVLSLLASACIRLLLLLLLLRSSVMATMCIGIMAPTEDNVTMATGTLLTWYIERRLGWATIHWLMKMPNATIPFRSGISALNLAPTKSAFDWLGRLTQCSWSTSLLSLYTPVVYLRQYYKLSISSSVICHYFRLKCRIYV